MYRGPFDRNRDGKMDRSERATEFTFLQSVMVRADDSGNTHSGSDIRDDKFDEDEF